MVRLRVAPLTRPRGAHFHQSEPDSDSELSARSAPGPRNAALTEPPRSVRAPRPLSFYSAAGGAVSGSADPNADSDATAQTDVEGEAEEVADAPDPSVVIASPPVSAAVGPVGAPNASGSDDFTVSVPVPVLPAGDGTVSAAAALALADGVVSAQVAAVPPPPPPSSLSAGLRNLRLDPRALERIARSARAVGARDRPHP